MYGAFLGDMIGAPYEFLPGRINKDFPLLTESSVFTDDSVMTAAVAEALMETLEVSSDEQTEQQLITSMRKWGRKYPAAGYGGFFFGWLYAENPRPYGSYGNGSAMRVSSAGWLYHSLEKTEHMAELTARVTHNHPEGIKGAVVTAGIIFLARNGSSKEEIRTYAEEKGYSLSRTCAEIRQAGKISVSCQETLPAAIAAFLEGEDYEDIVRTAVSLGGDTDTVACIAGSMAEAYYGVPQELKEECLRRLPEDMNEVLRRVSTIITE